MNIVKRSLAFLPQIVDPSSRSLAGSGNWPADRYCDRNRKLNMTELSVLFENVVGALLSGREVHCSVFSQPGPQDFLDEKIHRPTLVKRPALKGSNELRIKV